MTTHELAIQHQRLESASEKVLAAIHAWRMVARSLRGEPGIAAMFRSVRLEIAYLRLRTKEHDTYRALVRSQEA